MLLAVLAVAAAAAVLAACSSSATSSAGGSAGTSTSSPVATTAGSLKTATIGGATVLTNAQGFTLYSFAPDTPTKSNCNGTCAQNWPPVKGPATASGVTGTFGTITRADGSVQATFDGHPLYAFAGDTAPGQDKGNGLNRRRPVARNHHLRHRPRQQHLHRLRRRRLRRRTGPHQAPRRRTDR